MDEYWFCGIFPDVTVNENELTPQQKQIAETEKNKINEENYYENWLGYQIEKGWRFMRHGLIVETIAEEKSNIARLMLYEILKQKY